MITTEQPASNHQYAANIAMLPNTISVSGSNRRYLGEEGERSAEPSNTGFEEQFNNSHTRARGAKWAGWMDRALVRQVLATDPITCGRGNTVSKWGEVSATLQTLQPQPIVRSGESCRQRMKKLVEIYKVSQILGRKSKIRQK